MGSQMINAQTDEIAITKNVFEGLNAIIAALDLAGDNVVLCPDLEHPNNVYPGCICGSDWVWKYARSRQQRTYADRRHDCGNG